MLVILIVVLNDEPAVENTGGVADISTIGTVSTPTELELSVDVVIEDGFPFIDVFLNLPNGALVMATVDGNGYTGQDSEPLNFGRAILGPFSQDHQPLPLGEYSLRITAPLANVQPQEIRGLLGDNYANFYGEHFFDNEIGLRSIVFETTFTVNE